ncbi:MAG: hypothetical protein ABIG61_03240 [Planctomycetota bacterium]
MTPRDKFIMALEGKQPPGRVPHFELVFFLTMEAFGRVHPVHRRFEQWRQMSENERKLHMWDIADVYIEIAEKYEHSAIFIQGSFLDDKSSDMMLGILENIRQITDDRFIFSTSNCIYTGMDLKRYEIMLDIWRKEGNYAL